MDRASAARLAGMDRQTLHDWVQRYNAEGIAGVCDRPKPRRTLRCINQHDFRTGRRFDIG